MNSVCGESVVPTTPRSACCVVSSRTTQRKRCSVCGVSPPNAPCVCSRHKA